MALPREMTTEFMPITTHQPGVIAALLNANYSELVKADSRWKQEQVKWEEYDREVFAHPDTVGACLFLTRLDGRIAGFASWDPRQGPAYAIIGHNCILPEFRGKGLGRQQIQEILRRFCTLGVRMARVSTNDHPFFVPAQRMYVACGFREVRRIPWDQDPDRETIEYLKDLGQQHLGGDAPRRACHNEEEAPGNQGLPLSSDLDRPKPAPRGARPAL